MQEPIVTTDTVPPEAAYRRASVEFRELVEASLPQGVFQIKMISLIQRYPRFLPPYLEVLELLEGMGLTADYDDFLGLSERCVERALATEGFIEDMAGGYSVHELVLVRCLLRRLGSRTSPGARAGRLDGVLLNVEAAMRAKSAWRPSTHTEYVEDVDVSAMKQSLQDKEHHWFAVTQRQGAMFSHRHTQVILLRGLTGHSVVPVAADGPHESLRTPQAAHFAEIVAHAEEFARARDLGLGRVALVRLRPGQLVYRHYDAEEYLQHRTRYHLIVDAQDGNLLILGDAVARIREGQLWRYGNQTMHKSYNDSSEWRVNLILDAYPIASLGMGR